VIITLENLDRFFYNFYTVVSRKKCFTHIWQKCPPHLNNVLMLPRENETSRTRHNWTSTTHHSRFHSARHMPPKSPDNNPVDYAIWSVIQQRVYDTRVHNIDELRQHLLHVWRGLEQLLINDAVDQWRTRLHVCVHGFMPVAAILNILCGFVAINLFSL